MHAWFHDDLQIYLVLELAVKGNLYDRIQKGRLGDVEAATVRRRVYFFNYFNFISLFFKYLSISTKQPKPSCTYIR